MDGRNKYVRALKLISELPFGAEISLEALKKLIMINLVSNEKRVFDTIELMKKTDLIVEIENMKFRVVHNGNL